MWTIIKCVLLLSVAVAAHGYVLGPRDVVFHLFTRSNPQVSEPLLPSEGSIATSSFQRTRRTIFTIHNYGEGVGGNFNAFVIRAHLLAEDVNVIAIDWSPAASFYSYALANMPQLGRVIASFIDLLDSRFGYSPDNIRIAGLGLGAHAAGIAARNINGNIPHIVALDPSLVGWTHHPEILSKDDASVVEVIHTSAGAEGYDKPLGDLDFYPNGGTFMAGCGTNSTCSHIYSYVYYAESLTTELENGKKFVGTACDSYENAINLACQGERGVIFGGSAVKRTENPRVSQPLMPNNVNLLSRSNYKSIRRTIVLIHGWMNSATSNFNSVLLRALLAAEDVNVIVVDWSSGSNSLQYREVNANAISSGSAVAQFINWLNQNTGSVLAQYHIIGHGVGGHQAGIVGSLNLPVHGYITGLDPALIGWVNNIYRFRPSDALYSEVIHTNYGVFGYLADLAKVDFYPNGGISMPGCDSNGCDHERGFQYLAESIASGGFRGRECMNYYAAVLRMCNGPRQLQMGGLEPKTGASGVYFLETNAQPPFSQG
ncbi:inactive lipase [Danaus plexippus plexippus]|uniref:Inactive lipase n=1 Tax=Danaus plexippus plexippus TaxID=278856 RepID=A0A212F9I6_DANPL|nr:inactive lipase [Danaus plexippus plexippus]